MEEYARTGRRELLERSSELGEQLDPQNGLIKVHRMLLAAGLTDEEAHQNLHSQARGRRLHLPPLLCAGTGTSGMDRADTGSGRRTHHRQGL